MSSIAEREGVEKLRRDLRAAAGGLGKREARFLVDEYYAMQADRIETGNQVRALTESGEPHAILVWLFQQHETLENEIKKALVPYTDAHAAGVWAKSITGIGPVLAAGLLAHIDIYRARTAGQIWRFAGLDPTTKWLGAKGAEKLLGYVFNGVEDPDFDEDAGDMSTLSELEVEHLDRELYEDRRGQLSREQIVLVHRLTGRKIGNLIAKGADDKGRVTRASMLKLLARRPWNANLKVLCWKIGESFVKVSGNPNDVYGKLYVVRKEQEIERNEAGLFADQAALSLRTKNYGKQTEAYAAYSQGMLPAARIHLRAERVAVKLFLAHYHAIAFRAEFGMLEPLPYVLDNIPGHTHYIAPPNLSAELDDLPEFDPRRFEHAVRTRQVEA